MIYRLINRLIIQLIHQNYQLINRLIIRLINWLINQNYNLPVK